MPNVNLIAERREEKKKLERTTRQLFFGFAGAVGLFASLVLYTGGKQLALHGELSDAKARMQKIQPALDRISQIEKETSEMTPKVETLQNAKISTLRWRAIFQVVSESVPPSTWLSNLSATGNSTGDDSALHLSGMTNTQAAVGDTMTHLNAHPLFDKVDLKFTQSTPPSATDAIPRVSFEIEAHLRYIGPPKPAAKDKDGKDIPPAAAAGTQKAAIAPRLSKGNRHV